MVVVPGPASWSTPATTKCLADRTPSRPGAAGVATTVVRRPPPGGPNHRLADSPCPAGVATTMVRRSFPGPQPSSSLQPLPSSDVRPAPDTDLVGEIRGPVRPGKREGHDFSSFPVCPPASQTRPPGISYLIGRYASGQERAGPGVQNTLSRPPVRYMQESDSRAGPGRGGRRVTASPYPAPGMHVPGLLKFLWERT